MKRYIALLCMSLAACSDTSAIKDAVRENLVDPDSAQFREIIQYTKANGVEKACIEVNAKNRMGGYAGDQIFLGQKGEKGEWAAVGLGSALEGLDCKTYLRIANQPSK